MAIDFEQAQRRLGVKVDGSFGPVSYQALMSKVCGRTIPLPIARSFATNCGHYGVEATPQRLSGFVGETAHESGCYVYTRELWNPTPAQRKYDQPGNKLGNRPGDGFTFRGGGWIQVTGRGWFEKIGPAINVDLVAHPELSGDPAIATLISLEWWKRNNANAVADTGDFTALSKLVNGGTNGLAERLAFCSKAMGILS